MKNWSIVLCFKINKRSLSLSLERENLSHPCSPISIFHEGWVWDSSIMFWYVIYIRSKDRFFVFRFGESVIYAWSLWWFCCVNRIRIDSILHILIFFEFGFDSIKFLCFESYPAWYSRSITLADYAQTLFSRWNKSSRYSETCGVSKSV